MKVACAIQEMYAECAEHTESFLGDIADVINAHAAAVTAERDEARAYGKHWEDECGKALGEKCDAEDARDEARAEAVAARADTEGAMTSCAAMEQERNAAQDEMIRLRALGRETEATLAEARAAFASMMAERDEADAAIVRLTDEAARLLGERDKAWARLSARVECLRCGANITGHDESRDCNYCEARAAFAIFDAASQDYEAQILALATLRRVLG